MHQFAMGGLIKSVKVLAVQYYDLNVYLFIEYIFNNNLVPTCAAKIAKGDFKR